MPKACIRRSGTSGASGRTPLAIPTFWRGRTIRFSAALVVSTLGFSWLLSQRSEPAQSGGRLEREAMHASALPGLFDLAGTHIGLTDPLAPDTALAEPTIVAVVMPVPVTVEADGRDREVTAEGGVTVGALLDRLGIEVDRDDRVSPPLAEEVSEGTEVVVRRVAQTVEARQTSVPVPVRERPTADLPEGERREVSAGREGVRHVVDRVTWVDGVPEKRVRVDEHVVTPPQPRIIEVGTGPIEEAEEALEDEITALVDSQTGGASWYVWGDELTAAHRTLPKGTIVTVTNLANGKSVDVRINDRGPYIAGRVIDLNKVAFAQIASVSDGVIDVHITW